MGLISGEGPTQTIVPLDQGTTNLIGSQQKTTFQSNADVAKSMNQGVGEAGNQMMPGAAGVEQAKAAFGGNGYSDAIRNQYNQVAGKNIQNVTRSNELNSSLMHSQWLQNYSNQALAQSKVAEQNYALQMQAMMTAEAVRAQMLGSVLGIVGVAGGMYAGRQRAPTGRTELRQPQVGESSGFGGGQMYGGKGTLGNYDFGSNNQI